VPIEKLNRLTKRAIIKDVVCQYISHNLFDRGRNGRKSAGNQKNTTYFLFFVLILLDQLSDVAPTLVQYSRTAECTG